MANNLKYPRFGGDRKYSAANESYFSSRSEQGARRCDCCENPVTHVVDVQVDWSRGDDDVYYVCSYHVGQARRFHTFEKFLAAAEGRD